MSTPLADPLGHELLATRLARIPEVLEGMLADPGTPLSASTLASQRFIVTGTGSSEAHARYLATLINLHTDRSAAYLPLSGFVDAEPTIFAGKTLVVYSQGVSPNAQIALQRGRHFDHTILFTATTPEAAKAAGKPDRADLLNALLERGGELVEFPLAEEYTTLIRFVGPLAGYLATLQFAAKFPGSLVDVPSLEELSPLLTASAPEAMSRAMRELPSAFAAGFNIITAAPICDYSQNLACKFMEGLFWNCPSISDFLQFAHGPFQQMTAHPKPVLILQGDGPGEARMVERSVAMLRGVGANAYVIQISAPPLLSIFGFEAALNDAVFRVMRHLHIDQVNWPGKGRDDQLYGFCPDSE